MKNMVNAGNKQKTLNPYKESGTTSIVPSKKNQLLNALTLTQQGKEEIKGK